MKDVDLAYVNSKLPLIQYAKRVVKVLQHYPVRDGFKTYEYQFKKQQPSKVSVPEADLASLLWQEDDDGNLYMVIDGTYIREVVENNWHRIVSRKDAVKKTTAGGEIA